MIDKLKRLFWRKSTGGFMAVGAFLVVPNMPFVTQCAPVPVKCAQKVGTPECASPTVVQTSNHMSANAYAGKQFLQESGQVLLGVRLLCTGSGFWTSGDYTNADLVAGPTVSAYWSCYPNSILSMVADTKHS